MAYYRRTRKTYRNRSMLRTRRSRSGYARKRAPSRRRAAPRTIRLVVTGRGVRVSNRRRTF